MDAISFNRVSVDCSALQHNYRFIQNRVGTATPVMAMVKADAYGHGMVEAAKAFAQAGCGRYGVAEIAEGGVLRESGIKGDIYVTIGFEQKNVSAFFDYTLIPVVYSIEAVAALSEEALSRGARIGVHVKVETGMGRLGLFPEQLPSFLQQISGHKGVFLQGIMSHFASAEQPGSIPTKDAIARFQEICSDVAIAKDSICHIANSGAVLNFPDAHCDMVRAGIALYGYDPAGNEKQPELRPALSFTTRILQVKTFAEGMGISYGHTFVTSRPTKIAVIPVGYEDGFSRGLSNRGKVLVRGGFAPIRGRVCMNMSMIDVTEIEGVEAGDEVVVLGSQGQAEITAEDIARQLGTISYEVLCNIGNNNLREYRAG